jgi:hypothetical protein
MLMLNRGSYTERVVTTVVKGNSNYNKHGRQRKDFSPLLRGSKSPLQRCQLCYAASSELSSLACAPLFVLHIARFCSDLEACNLMTATMQATLDTAVNTD